KAPPSRADVFSQMPGGPAKLNTEWLGRFLNNDSELLAELEDLEYAGTEKLGETTCHKIEGNIAPGPITLWVQSEGDPWLRQLSIDLSEEERDAVLIPTLTLSNWDAAPVFAADRFAFKAPEGVERMPTPREQM